MILRLREEIVNALKGVLVKNNFTLLKDKVILEESKYAKHGFFNTNLPYLISSLYSKKLEDIERIFSMDFPEHRYISKLEFTKGYINFFISPEVVKDFYISSLKEKKIIFSSNSESNKNDKYFIEIVSANPTGLLHIGHIRNGVITDTLSNILEYNGNSVFRSYLVNDCGTQVKELIASIHKFHSYISKSSPIDFSLGEIKYSDDNVRACAEEIAAKFGYYWELNNEELTKEITSYSVRYFLDLIKKELSELSIKVDSWDFESRLCNENSLSNLLSKIRDFIYLDENALWFKTKDFCDKCDKDDVIVKSNGELSYFGQDLIYHLYKLSFLGSKGVIVNTLAEDHKWHIQRMKAFFEAIGGPPEMVKYKTTQLSKLLVEGKKVVFSKRENIFLSLQELKEYLSIEEIRWFLSCRDEEGELDIDLQKLKNKDYNNPIFYILHACARAHSLLKSLKMEISPSELSFEELNSEIEQELVNSILFFQLKFQKCVQFLKPNILADQLYSLAQKFHSFYDNFSISNEANSRTKLARLVLVQLTLRHFTELLTLFRIEAIKPS